MESSNQKDPREDDAGAAALQSFEKWSNYLLVTTVAAAGWIASTSARFNPEYTRAAALWCFGISIVFGIFTLALIPLATEQRRSGQSIYSVEVTFRLFTKECRSFITQACRPQHLTFIAGILLYCLGTSQNLWPGIAVGALAIVYGYFSRPRPERGYTSLLLRKKGSHAARASSSG